MNFYTLHIENANQLRQEKAKKNQQTKDLLIRIKKVLDAVFDDRVNEIVQKSFDATLSELRDSLDTDMVQVPLATTDDYAWINNLNCIDISYYLNQRVHYGLTSDGNFYINYEIPKSCNSYNDLMSAAVDATKNKDLHNFYINLASLKNSLNCNNYKFENNFYINLTSLKNNLNCNNYKFENMQITQVPDDQNATQNKIVVNYHQDLSILIIDTLKEHGYLATKVYITDKEAIIVALKSNVDR